MYFPYIRIITYIIGSEVSYFDKENRDKNFYH